MKRWKVIKIGVMSVCLMTLVACSTIETKLIKQPLLCPITTACQQITVNITTNKDLVMALHKSLNQTDICVTAYQQLKDCINIHNKGDNNEN
ncbi:Rz1-like lysis system protein LysC [Gallibacterium anatis]|uniref:Rz1-like lysis system protein LysC n=2 Tax=Gallibacterium anatis TaxID=750 RepID=UPI0039FDBA87